MYLDIIIMIRILVTVHMNEHAGLHTFSSAFIFKTLRTFYEIYVFEYSLSLQHKYTQPKLTTQPKCTQTSAASRGVVL
jgi:hypothetical protein